ncbi:MAG: TetR/AcrR family transcriptional regulator [Glaciihabitans sp.]
MTDPRIKRTREHVLRTARDMLAQPSGVPLTLSALAAEAQVSRRTLYVHWGTIQKVISEAITYNDDWEGSAIEQSDPRTMLRAYLEEVRRFGQDPVSKVALSTMLGQAAQDPDAAIILSSIGETGNERFARILGSGTPEQYAELVGPILYCQFVQLTPASDDMIERLVDRGVDLLGLDDAAA